MNVRFDKTKNICYNTLKDENGYVFCPCCKKKKLLRIESPNDFSKIYVWCKHCKKEICLQSHEPKQ